MILLQQRHSKGQIYSLKAVWTFYSNRQGQKHQLESGVYRSNKCKDRIQGFIGDSATFVEPLNPSEPHLIVSSNLGKEALQYLLTESNWQLHTEDESCDDELRTDAIEDIDLDAALLSWLYCVTHKVHHGVNSVPTHGCIINHQKSAKDIDQKSLFILVSLLCTGSQEQENKAHAELKTRVSPRYSICGIQGMQVNAKTSWLGTHCSSGNLVERACAAFTFSWSLHQL